MKSQKTYPCTRRGCQGSRHGREFLCAPCWHQVDHHDREKYRSARRRRLTHIAKEIRARILKILLGKPMSEQPNLASLRPSVDPAAVYEATCARLGERV